eukprot:644290-Prorocentrum_minimum.AAC.3
MICVSAKTENSVFCMTSGRLQSRAETHRHGGLRPSQARRMPDGEHQSVGRSNRRGGGNQQCQQEDTPLVSQYLSVIGGTRSGQTLGMYTTFNATHSLAANK